jgi:uncharacterized protein (TIGR01777 family)
MDAGSLRVAVTGASGLLGSSVAAALRDDGHRVVRLVRRTPAAGDEIAWDPRAPDGGLDSDELSGVDAVVHLAGAGIGDRRWTPQYKAEIRDSRVSGTRALVTALTRMRTPPAVLLSGSAIGWYGDTGGREVTESSPAGTGFLPDLVKDWEAAARAAEQSGIRVVTLRTSPVLSRRGGMLPRLLPLFRFGLGAKLGTGGQVMSWLALADYVGILRFLLARPELSGPVNMSTPAPVTNAEFTAALAAVLHRPALFTVPTPALRLVLGEVSGDLLSSARVIPAKLLSADYEFAFPALTDALSAELE